MLAGLLRGRDAKKEAPAVPQKPSSTEKPTVDGLPKEGVPDTMQQPTEAMKQAAAGEAKAASESKDPLAETQNQSASSVKVQVQRTTVEAKAKQQQPEQAALKAKADQQQHPVQTGLEVKAEQKQQPEQAALKSKTEQKQQPGQAALKSKTEQQQQLSVQTAVDIKSEQQPAQAKAKAGRKRRSFSKSSPKPKGSQQGESSGKKKDETAVVAKSKTNGASSPEDKKGTLAAPPSDQQAPCVDVHLNCKKSMASLRESVQHWKSVVEKISSETQATNNLSAELKLAAIKAICDEAGKAAFPGSSRLGGDSTRPARKHARRQRNRQFPKQAATDPLTGRFSSNRPQEENQRQQPHYQPRRFQPKNVQRSGFSPHTYPNHQRGRLPYYDDQPHNARLSRDNIAGNRSSQRFSYQNVNLPHWIGQPDPSQMNSRSRFPTGPSMNPQHQNRSAPNQANTNQTNPNQANPNQQFNPLSSKHAQSQQTLPSLSSAASSDHPVCVGLREDLRRAEDVESLMKVIARAQAHKIPDLVDGGKRKLEKLQQKEQKNMSTA